LLWEHNDTVPADDPDDVIDPDDSALPELSAPLPSEMPANWWEALLFSKPADPVLPQDAHLVLALIEARLGEYLDSGRSIKRDPGANVSVANDLPGTVGALHERIYELYAQRGWFMFEQLYHEAAGLHPRPKTANSANAVSATDAMPASIDCSGIEPGLAEAVIQAPSRVRRWMLAPPREPPPWRRQESEGERAHREALEDLGGWAGG
jgi:hypothetical protein